MSDSEESFSSLPPELKVSIFYMIGSKERQSLRVICKSWDTLISQIFGVHIILNNENRDLCFQCNSSKIHAIFTNFTYPMLGTVTTAENLPVRLTSLTFSGFIASYNLVPLLQELTNLNRLEFNKIKIFGPNWLTSPDWGINTTDKSKLLPNLKHFKCCYKLLRPGSAGDHMITILNRLSPFLTGSKLVTFAAWNEDELLSPNFTQSQGLYQYFIPAEAFGLEVDSERTGIVGHPVDEFYKKIIQENRNTLSKVKFEEENFQRSTKIKLYPNGGQPSNNGRDVIKEFRCGSYRKDYLAYAPEIDWLVYLGTQKSLLKFDLSDQMHHCWGKVHRVLTENRDALIQVSINNFENPRSGLYLNPPQGPIWCLNASHLAELTRLENLMIKNTREYEGRWTDFIIWSEIEQINCLPSSIRILKLSLTISMEAESNFCAGMFQNLNNLEVFEFSAHPWFRCGTTMIVRLDAGKILNLIAWLPKIKQLKLRNRILTSATLGPELNTNSILVGSMEVLKLIPGIDVSKVKVSKEDGCRLLKRIKRDYFMDIRITPEYREWEMSNT